MKKILICALALNCAFTVVAAQGTENGTHTSFSHWSVGLKGGANYFRVVPSTIIHPNNERIHAILGGTVEYSFNPLAGIGLELVTNPYGSEVDASRTLDGSTFDVVPYFSVNLSNLLAPYRNGFWRKLNIYSESGLGIGFYNYSLNNAPVTVRRTALARTGINMEYNFCKLLALAVEGQYRFYERSDLGGEAISKGYCEALNATVGLRVKFGAFRKQHARNCSMVKSSRLSVKNKFTGDLKETTASLDSVEQANVYLKRKLQVLQERLNALAFNQDSVTVKDSPVASFQNIEFKFDSSTLTEASLPVLDQIAGVLLNDGFWSLLQISGNADSTGPAKYNRVLSVRRANMVKNYLTSKKVQSSKITTVGNGEEKPIATNATSEGRQKNRRVDFEIVK